MKIFTPVELGGFKLRNRMVIAPMTRLRSNAEGVPSASAPLYYAQRSGAGLIVSEGVCISAEGVGDLRLPGIWTVDQIEVWKKVTAAVHAENGLIIAQLWHTGRASHPLLQSSGAAVAPSAIAIKGTRNHGGKIIPQAVPRALDIEEIPRVVADYARAAKSAIDAGFDGVELHGANGYLVDQFLQDVSNTRTDAYGGSVENRTRFLKEVVYALVEAVGSDRVAVRISPASTFQSMGDSQPEKLWAHVLSELSTFNLAFLHSVEPGISGASSEKYNANSIDHNWIRSRYSGNLVATGQYTLERAEQELESGTLDAVGFGRLYTSNPDLAERFQQGAALIEPDPSTFYQGEDVGYIDWPSMEGEQLLRQLESDAATIEEVSANLSADQLTAKTSLAEWPRVWALSEFRALKAL
jgi:N-ethylmaleimide reductase